MYSARVLMNGLMFGENRKPGDIIPSSKVSSVSHVVIKSMVNQMLIELIPEGGSLKSIPNHLMSDNARVEKLEAKLDVLETNINKLLAEVFKPKKPRGRPAANKQNIINKESNNGTES